MAAVEEEELGLLWWSWFWLDTVRRGFLFSAPHSPFSFSFRDKVLQGSSGWPDNTHYAVQDGLKLPAILLSQPHLVLGGFSCG